MENNPQLFEIVLPRTHYILHNMKSENAFEKIHIGLSAQQNNIENNIGNYCDAHSRKVISQKKTGRTRLSLTAESKVNDYYSLNANFFFCCKKIERER